MKTLSEFEKYYDSTLIGTLMEVDSLRKKTIMNVFYIILIYLASVALLISLGLIGNYLAYEEWLPAEKDNVPLSIAIVVSLVGLYIPSHFLRKNHRKYIAEFKQKIISEIVHFVDPSLTYKPQDAFPFSEFVASKIFLRRPDRYIGDDLIFGRLGATDIAFSEVHALYKTESGDDDKDKWSKLFDGLFFKADFHKNFNGEYFIMPDFAERTFGRFGKFMQKMNKSRGQLVSLEDPEFEKEFAVYGSDQVEARYILSSSMMSRLLDYKRKTNKAIMISFVRSSIYIALPSNRYLFEPRILLSVVNRDKTIEYFNDMSMALSIVEELNLNTRIWGKE